VGVDETAYLRANATRSTTFATGIAERTPGRPARLLDVVEGRSSSVLAQWLTERDPAWRAAVTTASLDPFRGYATALSSHLPAAVRVLDAFHVVRVRREAPCVQVGCKDPPPVCRSRPVELRAA
jgi:transposase